MSLVKCILGKVDDHVPHFIRHIAVPTLSHSTLERLLLLVQDGSVFLANRLSERVCLSSVVPGVVLSERANLLLENGQAIRFLQEPPHVLVDDVIGHTTVVLRLHELLVDI